MGFGGYDLEDAAMMVGSPTPLTEVDADCWVDLAAIQAIVPDRRLVDKVTTRLILTSGASVIIDGSPSDFMKGLQS